MGSSTCNKGIQYTLKNDPENFWYYNNGITILCDEAELNVEDKFVRMVNPQIVNGCQTAMSLVKFSDDLNGDVMIRLIEAREHDFINALTLYQNSSNPVKKRDLKSNDPIQIRLKREFAMERYYYEIKRGEEFNKMKRKYPSMKQLYINVEINNEEVAKVLAALKLNPGIAVGKGSEEFFGNSYDKIFTPNLSSINCLAPTIMYWMIRETYLGDNKKFHSFNKSYVFKGRASFYVLKFICDSLTNCTNWEKKIILFYQDSNEKIYNKFVRIFGREISEYFEILYKAWRASGVADHNTYLQNPDTVKYIEKKYNSQITRLNREILKTFQKYILDYSD